MTLFKSPFNEDEEKARKISYDLVVEAVESELPTGMLTKLLENYQLVTTLTVEARGIREERELIKAPRPTR